MKEQLNKKYETKNNTMSVRNCKSWMLFVLILILIFAFFSGILPIKPVVVATGSMEPEIEAGDVVLICKTDTTSLEVGDVIEYQGNGYTVIHRIISINEGTFITQGDANNAPDSSHVSTNQINGKVIFTVPQAGKFTIWLHNLYESREG